MKITKTEWDKAQEFEKAWWTTSRNTFGEEVKQLFYAKKMGLDVLNYGQGKVIDCHNQSVCDIGGGIVSLLLKAKNLSFGAIVEPMPLVGWGYMRYLQVGLNVIVEPAETVKLTGIYDEIWIYNVLQHTQDPKAIIENAKKHAKLIRIFEWLDTPPHDGHPQTLRQKDLDKWLGGEGRVEELDPETWDGYNKSYYGVFPTKHYGKKMDK